jgi:hypothetical protein
MKLAIPALPTGALNQGKGDGGANSARNNYADEEEDDFVRTPRGRERLEKKLAGKFQNNNENEYNENAYDDRNGTPRRNTRQQEEEEYYGPNGQPMNKMNVNLKGRQGQKKKPQTPDAMSSPRRFTREFDNEDDTQCMHSEEWL